VLVPIDTFGLSVLRDNAANEEFERTVTELKARAEARGKERFFHGICSFTARSIRYSGNDRFLCVYDTALPNKPNHADIFGPDLKAIAGVTMSKGEQERQNRARIKQFIDLIGNCFIPAANFRDGALTAHCRPKET
jgi:hypothetical protein